MLSSEKCIQGGRKLSDRTRIPGLCTNSKSQVVPSIGKERGGEEEKDNPSSNVQRYILHTAFLFGMGMEPRASCMLSTDTELYRQPSVLKVK